MNSYISLKLRGTILVKLQEGVDDDALLKILREFQLRADSERSSGDVCEKIR